MGETSTLFGLVHDLQDRRRQRRVRDARRNYLTDPVSTIHAVNDIDPDMGLALRDDYEQRQHAEQTAEAANRERELSAARGLTQGLMRVKEGGGDLGAAFEQTVPVLREGFGLDDNDINEWRTRITTDPTALDNMNRLLNEPDADENKLYDLAPGARLFDRTGRQIAESPALPRSITVKRADGGSDVLVMDENGNFVQSGQASGAPGVASVPGRQNINPQSRGMRNSNPGNIKDGPWARSQPGYAGSDGTFARFDSLEAGQAAQERLLQHNYVNGRRNVSQIVDKYLDFRPGESGENSRASRDNYITYVAGQIGLNPSAPVPSAMLQPLAQAMREFENGGGPATGGSGQAPRPAYSTAAGQAADDGWRDLTPEENEQRGLDPSRRYQLGIGGDNEGRIVEVPGQARPKAGQLAREDHSQAVRDLQRVRDEARALRTDEHFDQATGSVQGRLPSIFQGSVDFDNRLDAFVSKTVVNALLRMKQNSPNGATGFGAMNATEGAWVRDSEGNFRQSSPETLRRELTRHERDAMISIGTTYNIPVEATQMLLQNPNLSRQFDEKYGAGRARDILGDR